MNETASNNVIGEWKKKFFEKNAVSWSFTKVSELEDLFKSSYQR